jgi:hypothetical protein
MAKRDRRFTPTTSNTLLALDLALALVAGAGPVSPAAAQPGFPRIPLWAYAGAYQDSSIYNPYRCVGSFQPLADSLRQQARTISVRFRRDRLAELRPDFAGYRIWRVTNSPDTSQMVLLRRFSLNADASLSWNFSRVDTSTLEFMCGFGVVHDSIVTFVDPDSSGNWVKVCRKVDRFGRCLTPRDSVWKLIPPPGPHDGFRTWYSITYEGLNTADNVNLDLFVPGPYDTSGNYANCGTPGDSTTCPRINLNNKAANIIPAPIEPTAGPAPALLSVSVVPNPYRGSEAWDLPGGNELHFINLPSHATIKIYTVAGDLVTTLEHNDAVRDFERWDLKNQSGHDIASGIYMYRVVSGTFSFQNRFIVIR